MVKSSDTTSRETKWFLNLGRIGKLALRSYQGATSSLLHWIACSVVLSKGATTSFSLHWIACSGLDYNISSTSQQEYNPSRVSSGAAHLGRALFYGRYRLFRSRFVAWVWLLLLPALTLRNKCISNVRFHIRAAPIFCNIWAGRLLPVRRLTAYTSTGPSSSPLSAPTSVLAVPPIMLVQNIVTFGSAVIVAFGQA